MIIIAAILIGSALLYAVYRARPWLPKLRTVADVKLKRYAGTWYEIARLPMYPERDCTNVRATYTPREGFIEVYNQAIRASRKIDIRGKAYVDPKNNAKLSVYFSKF
jgi:apolipoprotein D and lipocalin family protein